MTELVTDGLCYWARQAPGRPAIVFDGTDRVDYQELDRWTDAAATPWCHPRQPASLADVSPSPRGFPQAANDPWQGRADQHV